MFCNLNDLKSESDVEQMFVYPFLTSPAPLGLGYSSVDLRTKHDIRKLSIGKGDSKKLYYPDHVIIISGLPIFIVEVKPPGEDIDEAAREARMYASELNSLFSSGINPCVRVVATDGHRIVSGPHDTKEYDCDVTFQEVDITNPKYDKLLTELSRNKARQIADRILRRLKSKHYYRPISLLGGTTVRDEEIPENSFGRRLALRYRHLFNPKTKEDRAYIVKHAYVRSTRRDRYVEPIDTIIRAAIPISVSKPVPIKDTGKPQEIIDMLKGAIEGSIDLDRQVLLLVGSVGAGKSTFIDYLREVALPADVQKHTVWLHLNLNEAPIDGGAYTWVSEKIIEEFKRLHKRTDFDDPEIRQRIFSVEIMKLKRLAAGLLEANSPRLNEMIFDRIVELERDVHSTAAAMTRYFCSERQKALIVVLDNCDKQKRDQQLFMFQVAQWVKEQFRCLVFLPIRDVTYENHRLEPPLDTALKDLVFRIDPPRITDVLKKRIDLAFRQMCESSNERVLHYTLANGIKVEYPQTEQGFYLACILKSLFEHDKVIRQVLIGLARDDVRRAMEIFLEFCTSGHIDEAEIFKMKQMKGNYALDFQTVARVLLRMNGRFYDGDKSYLKNLYQCYPDDPRPDHLVRYRVLGWLKDRLRVEGTTGVEGFHKTSHLLRDLVSLGHDVDRTREEILYFVKAGCIIPESQSLDSVSDDDLICISPSGEVHLALFDDLNYVAACAEDVWYSRQETANRVSTRLTRKGREGHYSSKTTLVNAMDLIQYMDSYISSDANSADQFLDLPNSQMDELFNAAKATIQSTMKNMGISSAWHGAGKRYVKGSTYAGVIKSVKEFGLFVELEPGIDGLVPKIAIDRWSGKVLLTQGTQVLVRVFSIEESDFRISLDLVDAIEKPALSRENRRP
jgi:hypothetical protein